MIIGLGIDIVEIARIKRIIMEKEEQFLNKLFTLEEQRFIPPQDQRKIEYIAGRFAGKEAVAKALGTGIGKALAWRDIEIIPLPTGKPVVQLKNGNKNHHILISISHTSSLAMAEVIIEEK